ncbi:MAG: bifunctional adenosylcobinamide kinase/adenosylcobinamide-phosphate guanylyltransferase [Chloroflexi bacterium]|nr:bifunctional adenosylcobinamide kinase/adenosylcobinamide-phosphate guanylyltransferase [Chloroflexota bacterium]
MTKQLILILGGARAGKSELAQNLAGALGKTVLFVATAEAKDPDMAARIAAHRKRRPPHWELIEEPLDLAGRLSRRSGHTDVVLLDCLTLWVSNLLLKEGEDDGSLACGAAEQLVDLYRRDASSWIVVSNEVGLGVVPPTPLGRAYRDALGAVNQIFARRADRVYLVVAGLALELKSLGARNLSEIEERLSGRG